MVSKINFIKSISITIFILILYVGVLISVSHVNSLIFFSLLCLFSTIPISVNTTISHPRIIFGIFFYLYNSFYFYFLLIRGDFDSILIIESIAYASTAILTYYLVITFLDFLYGCGNDSNRVIQKKRHQLSLKIIYFVFFILSFLICLYAATLGLSKRDLQQAIGFIASLAQFSTLYLVVLTLLVIYQNGSYFKRNKKLIISTLFLLIIYYLIAGERGDLFRIIICFILVYYERLKKIPITKLYLFIILGIFILPITQAFKSALTGGGSDFTYSLASLFFGEFSSASRNLYLITKYGSLEGTELMILTDLIRALIPFSSQLNIESSVYWYHTVYRPHFNFGGDVGWGLGLVPQGVLLGGHFGIVILFSIISLITHYLYRIRYKSEYYYVFYIMFITTLVYCLRADFANLISVSFKIVLFLYILLHLGHFILRKKN